MWRRVARAVVLCATAGWAHAQPAPGARLSQVQQILEAGAPDLALRQIELAQPAPERAEEWAAWERLRFTAYQKSGNHRALLDRLQVVPASLLPATALPLRTHAVELLLDAGVKADYETLLRSLIWHPGADPALLGHWRRLVIRAWQQLGRLEDARLAIANYQREYLPGDPDWLHLHARVLLQSGDARGAAALLSSSASEEGRLLRLLARLRAGVDLPARVLEQTQGMQRDVEKTPRLMALAHSVMAEAAERGGSHAQRVAALEQLFRAEPVPAEDVLFAYSVGDLWDAYLRYAENLGNSANLLVGEEQAWLAFLEKEKDGLRRRAVYALLAERAPDPQSAEYHGRLLDEMQKAALEPAALRLYQDSRRYGEIERVPAALRYRIVALAADRQEYALAARMAGNLGAPPGGGTDATLWTLTAARVAIYAGDFEKGAGRLEKLITETPAFDDDSADRALLVIFDLQGVDEHQAALKLLEALHPKLQSPRLRREVLFWMADSADAERRHPEAAGLYLRSAVAEAGGNDLWGHSARFRAAESLVAAGLVDDARAVYRELLRVTADPKRRSVIQRNLQDLALKKTLPKPGAQ
jgi:hypothetical protein